MADRTVDVRRSPRDPHAWEVVDPDPESEAVGASPDAVGIPPRVFAVRDAEGRTWVAIDGLVVTAAAPMTTARRAARTAAGDGLSAPMPATVISVQVGVGDTVAAGDTLVLLEAMKMEVPLRAPYAGVVSALRCSPGALVQPGVALVDLEEPS